MKCIPHSCALCRVLPLLDFMHACMPPRVMCVFLSGCRYVFGLGVVTLSVPLLFHLKLADKKGAKGEKE